MKKTLSIALATLTFGTAMAAGGHSALSLPGYFGSINNNTNYVIECSKVIGGYCANNPMPANGYIQMLPDPGSHMIKFNLMVFEKDKPGKYLDNIPVTYSMQKNGSYAFKTTSLYSKVGIKMITPDTILLEKKGAK